MKGRERERGNGWVMLPNTTSVSTPSSFILSPPPLFPVWDEQRISEGTKRRKRDGREGKMSRTGGEEPSSPPLSFLTGHSLTGTSRMLPLLLLAATAVTTAELQGNNAQIGWMAGKWRSEFSGKVHFYNMKMNIKCLHNNCRISVEKGTF